MINSTSKVVSLLKTATWYVSDSILTGIVSYAVTREVSTSLSIAALQQTCELVLYYFHERVWVRFQSQLDEEK
jgi:uncharacterized membrane protein